MKAKRYLFTTISLVLLLLVILGALVAYVDPFFHYHAPRKELTYRMREERYSNPGIVAHFQYDTIITGTSMSRNIMPSVVDEKFGTKSVKVPIPGAQLADIGDLLTYAYDKHEGKIERVIVSLDVDRLINDKDCRNNDTVPQYLYDNNVFNDVNYLFNKSVLVHDVLSDLILTVSGEEGTSLDEYGQAIGPTGREVVLAGYNGYTVEEAVIEQRALTEKDEKIVIDNVEANYASIVAKHPETKFYFYIPPYSVAYWNRVKNEGNIYREFEALRQAMKVLAQYDNVEIYDFYGYIDIISDLDNYYDNIHFDRDVSDFIVEKMSDRDNIVNQEYIDATIDEHIKWFESYNYESMYE